MSNLFKPTFLYIKQHIVTGKLYFGKTVGNPEKYLGSGSYWKNHIKKHGKEHVVNLWYCLFYDKDDCTKFSLNFSEQNNIVASNEWANQALENGLDLRTGIKHSEVTKQKISKSVKKHQKIHPEHKLPISKHKKIKK